MDFTIKTSIGTFGLILVNIIVFLIFGYSYSSTDSGKIYRCVKQSYPQCLEVDQNYIEVLKCMQKNPNDRDPCMYNISSTCLKKQQITQSCYPQDLQTSNNLSFVPALIKQGKNLYTIITSMFMHGSWSHLIGNMVFLFFAGVFIERRIGTGKFLIFYLLIGLCSTLIYFLFNQGSYAALLGASGAISGLMGANLILDFFKSGPRNAGVPFFRPLALVLFIIYQIGFQIFASDNPIAYLAHIGGFFAGMLLVFYFKREDDVYMAEPAY